MKVNLKSRVFRLIRYFNFFDYPADLRQIEQLLNITYKECYESVQKLYRDKLIDKHDGFVFIPGKKWSIKTRKIEEAIFKKRKKQIYRCGWILSHFPFVRGIMLTGSASKGVLRKHDDFDFFILTKPGRIWICRTIIIIFRKLISLNYRLPNYKFFCVNYFKNSKSLEISEENDFTAFEIATAQPMFNTNLYNQFIDLNKWSKKYFPGNLNQQIRRIKFRFRLVQIIAEFIINLFGGNKLERFLSNKFYARWNKNGSISSRKEFNYKCNYNHLKLHPGFRPNYITSKLNVINENEHHNRLRTKLKTHYIPKNFNLKEPIINILLTHAYYLSKTKSEKRILKPYVPLGPLSVASYLKEKGHEVSFYDTTFIKSEKEFRKYILKNSFSLVGIYVLETTRKNALKMINICITLGIEVLVGGPDPSNNPQFYLDCDVKAVIVGEGEETLHEFMEALNSGSKLLNEIDGLYIKESQNKPRTVLKDLDKLPMPARELVDFKSYNNIWKKHHGLTSMHMTTSRGCPYRCTWCAKPVFGSNFRQRSAILIANEIEYIKNQYNPDQIWFTDDILGLNKDWIFRLQKELKKRNIKIPFECLSRVDLVDKDSLRALKEMGCFRIWFGAESGSQKIIDKMKKGFKVEQIKTASKLVNEAGIDVGFFIMLGYPTETKKDIDLTRKLLNEVSPQYFGTAIAYPMHNTEFYKEVESSILPRRHEYRLENDNKLTFKASYPQFFYSVTRRLLSREKYMRSSKKITYKDKIKYEILKTVYNLMGNGIS